MAEFFVKVMGFGNKKQYTMDTDKQKTISDVKKLIFNELSSDDKKKIDNNFYNIKIIYAARDIENNIALNTLGIQGESTLHAVFKLPNPEKAVEPERKIEPSPFEVYRNERNEAEKQPSQENSFELYYRMLTGQHKRINVYENQSFGSFLIQLEKETGIDAEKIRILFCGKAVGVSSAADAYTENDLKKKFLAKNTEEKGLSFYHLHKNAHAGHIVEYRKWSSEPSNEKLSRIHKSLYTAYFNEGNDAENEKPKIYYRVAYFDPFLESDRKSLIETATFYITDNLNDAVNCALARARESAENKKVTVQAIVMDKKVYEDLEVIDDSIYKYPGVVLKSSCDGSSIPFLTLFSATIAPKSTVPAFAIPTYRNLPNMNNQVDSMKLKTQMAMVFGKIALSDKDNQGKQINKEEDAILGLNGQINAAIELYLPNNISEGIKEGDEEQTARELLLVLITIDKVKMLFKESDYKKIGTDKIEEHKKGMHPNLYEELIHHLNELTFVSSEKYKDKHLRKLAINTFPTRETLLGIFNDSSKLYPEKVMGHLKRLEEQPMLLYPQKERKEEAPEKPIDLDLFQTEKRKKKDDIDDIEAISSDSVYPIDESGSKLYNSSQQSERSIEKREKNHGDSDNKDTAVNAGNIAGFGLGLILGAGGLATLGALIVVAHPVVVGIIAVAAIMLAANTMSVIAGKIAGAAYSFFRPPFPTKEEEKEQSHAQKKVLS